MVQTACHEYFILFSKHKISSLIITPTSMGVGVYYYKKQMHT